MPTYLNYYEDVLTMQLLALPLDITLLYNSLFHPNRLTVSGQAGSEDLSKSMLALITTHAVAAATMLPYGVYVFLGWSPPTTQPRTVPIYNPTLLFWLGLSSGLYIVVSPIAVFFLTLDRLLTLNYGPRYGQREKKLFLYLEVGVLIGTTLALIAFKRVLEMPLQVDKSEGIGCCRV